MTEKELKRLSRADLLQMLTAQSKEVQRLQEKLEQAEAKLNSREIVISEAGSIAQASLQLNGIFAAAEAASQQYLENVRQLTLRREAVCAQMEQECEEKVSQRLAETESKCSFMETEAKVKCAEMIARAKAESQSYWDEVSAKLEAFYQQYSDLRDLLSAIAPRQK